VRGRASAELSALRCNKTGVSAGSAAEAPVFLWLRLAAGQRGFGLNVCGECFLGMTVVLCASGFKEAALRKRL